MIRVFVPILCAICAGATPPRVEDPTEEFRQIARDLTGGNNPYFGQAQIAGLQASLANPALPPHRKMALRFNLGKELLRVGKTDEAIEAIEEAMRIARTIPAFGGRPPPMAHLTRAIAYLRQAENENCVRRHNKDCCLLPLRRDGVHKIREPALAARRSLMTYLRAKPDDLNARWLLNITAMALGEYPKGVSRRWRIPPRAFRSTYKIGRFENVASAAGVDLFNLAGGCVVDDFNRDGLLDILTTTWDPHGGAAYLENDAGGGFVDRSSAAGVTGQLGGLNCIAGDYDNDGDRDLFILRGAWLREQGRVRNSLLQNDGHGGFADVTRRAGVAAPPAPTQAAAFADVDNDGRLDLFVCNESRVALGDPAGNYPSQLFRNNGDGTFTDVAGRAGVTNDRFCKGVAAGDFDNDGWTDLYVSNSGPNRLYHNRRDGTFVDVAGAMNVQEPVERSFGSWFFDFDNDGWLDIFVAGYQADNADIAASYLGLDHNAVRPRLYRNDKGERFVDMTVQVGLDRAMLPMGCNFGDLDFDGYLDVYLGTGVPEYEALMPNIMLRNDAGRRFQDVTWSGGFGHLQKGHGITFADFDNDGDQDIYAQMGGFYPGDRFRNALFANPGHGHHYLYVQLVGGSSNRAGVGARIHVTTETPSGPRSFHRAVGSVSSFGGTPARIEIGLGQAERIRSLDVHWPVSGYTHRLADVPLDTLVEITESEPGWKALPLMTVPLKR